MANPTKFKTLADLRQRFGDVRKLKGSESLFVIGAEAARLYFRYSKVHARGRTFFGLREVDLRQLEGHNSFLCFLTDDDSPPLFVPYADFEAVFADAQPARDGQFKVQLIVQASALELYVARQGRFNFEAYVGFEPLERGIESRLLRETPELSHSQVQTLLAAIGSLKGYEVYVPEYDSGKLDWSLTREFQLRRQLPTGLAQVSGILREIDVVWVANGGNKIEGLYEVEHSTPVYSGLLRFNDVFLTDTKITKFSIVSNDTRRELFSRQLFRPTFRKSGLAELCSFLEYANVFAWHQRLLKGAPQNNAHDM
jgi:hypothetical protein